MRNENNNPRSMIASGYLGMALPLIDMVTLEIAHFHNVPLYLCEFLYCVVISLDKIKIGK